MRYKTPGYVRRLSDFLAEARISSGYESDRAVETMNAGERRLGPYVGGKFSYVDIYSGSRRFSGKEEISSEGEVVWAREYDGGIFDAKVEDKAMEEVYSFLKAAMLLFPRYEPYKRGPDEFRNGEWLYTDVCKGDMVSFKGSEIVSLGGRTLYALAYGGGLIKV